jgi:hypothetical protein
MSDFFSDCFGDIRASVGTMMNDEQKSDLKAMGEQFYGSIDMDKYQPKLATEGSSNLPEHDAEVVDRTRYYQLKKAIASGLQPDDLSEDERELLAKFDNSEQE